MNTLWKETKFSDNWRLFKGLVRVVQVIASLMALGTFAFSYWLHIWPIGVFTDLWWVWFLVLTTVWAEWLTGIMFGPNTKDVDTLKHVAHASVGFLRAQRAVNSLTSAIERDRTTGVPMPDQLDLFIERRKRLVLLADAKAVMFAACGMESGR